MPATRKKKSESYVLCINNAKAKASLEVRKLYRVVPDESAQSQGLIRVIDESGEDYLYPAKWFVQVSLAAPVRRALAATG